MSKTISVITQFKNLLVQSLIGFQNIILSKANSLKIMMPNARVHKGAVWIEMNPAFAFAFTFLIFFYPEAREHSCQWVLCTVHRTHTTFNVHIFVCYDTVSGSHILFMGLINLNFFIKNGSHGTIHTFKNYFATVFSVFSFSNNKFNLNRPKNEEYCWDMKEFVTRTKNKENI